MATTAAPAGERSLTAADQLLVAAAQLMTERGSTGVTLSEIAERSGVNAALVKYYFGNKSGLMMALLRRVLAPALREMATLLALPLGPEKKLRMHVAGLINVYDRHPFINRLMHQLISEDAETYGRLIADEFSRPVAEAQAAIVADGVADGCFRQVDPTLLYLHIVGACDHLFFGNYQMRVIFGSDQITANLKQRYIEHICETILSGILAD